MNIAERMLYHRRIRYNQRYDKFNNANYSMSDSNQSKTANNLIACIEALLFVSTGPVSVQQLSEALGHTQDEVNAALKVLIGTYREDRGIRIQEYQGRYQFMSAPEYAQEIEKFLGLEASARLSRAGLETLAIVAYRQPITRPGIDAVRGVNSDGALKSLLSKGLIQEVGRSEGPGRPILYGTTSDFLQHFGLESLKDLPPFELLEQEGVSPEEQRLLKD